MQFWPVKLHFCRLRLGGLVAFDKAGRVNSKENTHFAWPEFLLILQIYTFDCSTEVLIYKQNRSAALQKYYFLHFKVSGVLKGWKLSIQGLIHLLLKLNICTLQRGLDKGLFFVVENEKKVMSITVAIGTSVS